MPRSRPNATLLRAAEAWWRRPTNRVLALVALAYAATGASLLSYALDGGTGTPSQVEVALLAAAVLVSYYLSVRAGGA